MTSDDPMVRVVPGRLEAARKAMRLSQKRLAEEADLPQSTVTGLFPKKDRRRAVRLHRASLERLSEVLQVPVEWLTGDSDALALQPFRRRGPLRSAVESQFVTDCVKAYERDTNRLRNAGEAARRRSIEGEFVFALYAILDHRPIWDAVLKPARGREVNSADYWHLIRGDDRELPDDDEMDGRVAEAVIAAARLILKPWFDDVATVDVDAFIQWARDRS